MHQLCVPPQVFPHQVWPLDGVPLPQRRHQNFYVSKWGAVRTTRRFIVYVLYCGVSQHNSFQPLPISTDVLIKFV